MTKVRLWKLTFAARWAAIEPQYLDNDDPTTRRMMEGILAMEEKHADDLVRLLNEMGK